MVRRVLTAVTLGLFALYSQSLLVMWCLYFVERHDIVLYFRPEELGSQNPFAGASYVHQLYDSQHGKAQGALSLITVVERSSSYVGSTCHLPLLCEEPQKLFCAERTASELEGFSPPLIIPPKQGA